MKILGIALRKPAFNELTGAVVMGVGLWVLAVGVMRFTHQDISRADAGALLLVMLWGCVSARLGIRVGMGTRHLLANLVVTAVLLGVYQGAWAIAA